MEHHLGVAEAKREEELKRKIDEALSGLEAELRSSDVTSSTVRGLKFIDVVKPGRFNAALFQE